MYQAFLVYLKCLDYPEFLVYPASLGTLEFQGHQECQDNNQNLVRLDHRDCQGFRVCPKFRIPGNIHCLKAGRLGHQGRQGLLDYPEYRECLKFLECLGFLECLEFQDSSLETI